MWYGRRVAVSEVFSAIIVLALTMAASAIVLEIGSREVGSSINIVEAVSSSRPPSIRVSILKSRDSYMLVILSRSRVVIDYIVIDGKIYAENVLIEQGGLRIIPLSSRPNDVKVIIDGRPCTPC